jgi:hypothetical protein
MSWGESSAACEALVLKSPLNKISTAWDAKASARPLQGFIERPGFVERPGSIIDLTNACGRRLVAVASINLIQTP